jgi:hypothetical protein
VFLVLLIALQISPVAEQKACMMLNINIDYDWIMGESANYKTSIILNGRKQICHAMAIWGHVVKDGLDWAGWTGLVWTGPGKRGLSPCFTNRGLNL